MSTEASINETHRELHETAPSWAAPATPAGAVPRVIYVLGAGRSGSTILGVALGNCVDVFFAGELNKWLAQSGAPSLQDEERVGFWNTVRGDVKDATGLFGWQTACLERSSALFRPRKWPVRRRLRGEYRRVAEDLYRAIARATGATHIVDSSHYPLRARELQAIGGIDLYLVYLVRDPQSVVVSLSRKDVAERSFGLLTTNAYLWLTHVLSTWVFLRHPRERRMFLRHEDFRSDPAGTLRQILERVGSPAGVPDLGSLQTGVPLHGNRLVADDVVALEGAEPPPARRSLSTALLQLPWRIAFSLLRPAVRASALGTPPTPPEGR